MATFLYRLLVLLHRNLGTVLGVLIVAWSATGITMMYAGAMPRLDPETRLERLPALDFDRVHLTPFEAATSVGLEGDLGRTVLLDVMGRPAYRFGAGPVVTIFADDGELLFDVPRDQTRAIASRFMNLPADQVHEIGVLTEPDVWTYNRDRQMPLYKFQVDDSAGTELYVSGPFGEVTLMTTRRTRTLAWLGAIPHMLYFPVLRQRPQVWRQIVVWGSGLGCLLALMGLTLAVMRSRAPYAGLLRWHYLAGAVFGVFTLTWAFSGMMSMEPLGWPTARGLQVDRDTFTGGPLDLSRFAAQPAAAWKELGHGRDITEVEFVRIQDDPYYLVQLARAPIQGGEQTMPDQILVAADSLSIRDEPFSVESVLSRLRQAVPDVPIAGHQLLSEDDAYFYSRRGHQPRETSLPVLRVKFEDPDETWLYVDPKRSDLVATIHSQGRVHRWLYNGLHSFDFAFWYNNWTWYVAMIALSLGGLASSGAGLFLGFRRVRRSMGRVAKAVGLPATPRVTSQPTK
jgi:hypothetical protein